jgi:uncharacterized membrane protein YeiB
MNNRIIGFDLARAYAIFGMFIVNYNVTFGDYQDSSLTGRFLAMFAGNSSTVFIILAGMGTSLLAKKYESSLEEKSILKKVLLRRALFLFVSGLLLNLWWPADILHMYGCYMAIAAFILFFKPGLYLIGAAAVITVFHLLTAIIPYGIGWNFHSFQYMDFYTVEGFLRHTFYNGWNPVFPWMAYFLLGLYLGSFDWKSPKVQKRIFLIGLAMHLKIIAVEDVSYRLNLSEELMYFIHADYLPPLLPFLISTSGFSLILISGFMFIGIRVGNSKSAQYFALTGQMTFTHYVSHLTIGIIILSMITGKEFGENIRDEIPNQPLFILCFSVVYFAACLLFSALWSRYLKKGPLEILMRIFSDRPVKKYPAVKTV